MSSTLGIDSLMTSPYTLGAGKKFANNEAGLRLHRLEAMYVRSLTLMAMNRFKWEGLPDTIDVRFLEMQLYTRGLAVFFKNTVNDKFMAMQATPSGYWNAYDNPTEFSVVGNQFRTQRLTAVTGADKDGNELEAECVPIWANYTRDADVELVRLYAHDLAETHYSVITNAKLARLTKVVKGNENTIFSAAQLARQIDEGKTDIKLNTGGNGLPVEEMLGVLDLGVEPDAYKELHILRTRLWGEAMGMLGINNGNQDKKERLVAAEVNQNDDQTAAMRSVNLKARREAAEAINLLYPELDEEIKVSYEVDSDNPQQDWSMRIDTNDANKDDTSVKPNAAAHPATSGA